jgi:polar amino acid transport system substrate-binding protein
MRLATLLILLSTAGPALCAGPGGPLTITTEETPPASMMGADGVTGRETDKVREMMARTGTDYKIDLLPWKRAYMMALHQPQTCVYSTTRTPERERLFKWVGPTDEAEWQLWGRIDHEFPLKTLEDARKLRIGTYNGDALGEYLRGLGYTTDPVSNNMVNPDKLLLNRIDLWAVPMRPGLASATQFPWSDKLAPLLVFNRVRLYLACSPSVPDELVARLNAALAEMRRDGTFARLEHKYERWPEAARP